ncbi:MAG: hypothetical protein H6722_04860 [Sandaracinus sp.]|nr:hypothetical protein [Sandaracinus sp.]MCB9622365.1 hypothetical protein [Sandaracinus sp.]
MNAIERLRSDETLRREGVTLVVDAALARPLSEVVDLTGLSALAEAVLLRPIGERSIRDHVSPGFERLRDTVRERETKVGDLLPADAADELERLLLATPFPRFEWAREAVDPKQLEKLFAPILQDLLMQFVGKLPGVGALSAFARVGGKAAGALGPAKTIAADFSKSALASLRDAFSARLASDEGRALVEEIRAHAFRHVLGVPVDTILADFDRLPWREVAAVAPGIAEHDLRSALGHAVLRQEVAAFLEVEGARTVEDLLEEAGALADVRAYLRVQGEGVLALLLASDDFGAWLAKLA